MQTTCKSLAGILAATFVCSSNMTAASGENSVRPNIVLFLADDMTWRDCSPYGNRDVITPHISRLASEGVTFDNMFTSTAMCAPSRQQLYTGLFPVRNGAYPNHSMVHHGVRSVVHHFDDIGYRVALIGKTHFEPLSSFPFEFLGGHDHDNGQGTDMDLGRAKPLIAQDDQPFFLVVASNQPHTPWNRGPAHLYDEDKLTVPEYMIDSRETRRNLKSYYAEITYSDSLLGACLQYLEDAGKSENTIVIFTSEQGSQFPFAKWTCYDLGLKTAFVMRWPGKIMPGTRNHALTQYVDVVPTLLDAAGKAPAEAVTGTVDVVGNRGFDGKSFLQVVLNKQTTHRDFVFGIQTTRGIFSGSLCYPIRSVRSQKYKYILNLHSSSSFFNLVNTATSGLYPAWIRETADNPERRSYVMRYTVRPKEELYDIENDPYEMNNMADKPEMVTVKREMAYQLKLWMDSQGDKGLETEMNALSRIPKTRDASWSDYHEENLNRAILHAKP